MGEDKTPTIEAIEGEPFLGAKIPILSKSVSKYCFFCKYGGIALTGRLPALGGVKLICGI